VSERLTLERSFEFFKELLLRHSVQRPPFSVGLFSFQEMKAITEWMMDSYYRHYKLYQVRTLPFYIPTSAFARHSGRAQTCCLHRWIGQLERATLPTQQQKTCSRVATAAKCHAHAPPPRSERSDADARVVWN
jgi:hypothetical protein